MADGSSRRFSRRQVIQGLTLAIGGVAGSSVLAACGSPAAAPAAKPAETAKPAEAAKPAAPAGAPAATTVPAAAAPAKPPRAM